MAAQQFDGDVNVNGTLTSNGLNVKGPSPNSKKLVATIGGSLEVVGNIHSRMNLSVNGWLQAPYGNVTCSGVECKTVASEHVIARGNISALGNVNAGNMNVTGDIRLENADCAEEFEVDITCAPHITPGTVVVLGDEGCLRHSISAYDKRVAGVVSGGGDYKPGIILDRQQSENNRRPIALVGKVYCKVDAEYASVEVGDLLTTSSTPGHAMKADDPLKAFGAVIGKALRPLHKRKGLIPILVALQ